MLNAEKFFVKSNALKAGVDFSMLDYVRTLVRYTELTNVEAQFKEYKEAMEGAHPGIDVMVCPETTVLETLKEDANNFLKLRKEILALREELAGFTVTMDMVTALCPVDKVHITLMSHAIYSKVLLDEDLFDPDKGGVDFSKSISIFFEKGTITGELKDSLKATFNKILNVEGDYFYAVKPAKSDFEKSDMIHFLSRFSGKAKRDSKRNKLTKELVWGDYKYRTKTDLLTQRRAFTEFCAVVLDNASKHSVNKEETK